MLQTAVVQIVVITCLFGMQKFDGCNGRRLFHMSKLLPTSYNIKSVLEHILEVINRFTGEESYVEVNEVMGEVYDRHIATEDCCRFLDNELLHVATL
jgi:hypothetical protein